MLISTDKVVHLEFTVTDGEGNQIDSTEQSGPLVYLHGHNNIIPGLETALEGKDVADRLDVTLKPEEAYGETVPEMIQSVPRENFQGIDDIKEGMAFEAQGSNGETRRVIVTEVNKDNVTVDANHPLAGKTLNFDLTVHTIREATPEELANGHIHSEHGNHND